MVFQGDLTELQFADLIQILTSSGKSGMFRLRFSDKPDAKIYLKDGDITHAVMGGKEGAEVIYKITGEKEGNFDFEGNIQTSERTIKKDNMNLLMEAARRQDQWEVLREKIPSDDLVPDFKVDSESREELSLNTYEWSILSKISGKRTIEEISEETGRELLEVCRIIYGLITNGLIELKEKVN